jgi:hypothetical protein
MNSRESASLDRYITGNYGEDQFTKEGNFPDTAHANFLIDHWTGTSFYDRTDDGPEVDIIRYWLDYRIDYKSI